MRRKLALFCSVCGIVGGILIVIGAVLESAFPKPLWGLAGVCCMIGAVGNILNAAQSAKHRNKT